MLNKNCCDRVRDNFIYKNVIRIKIFYKNSSYKKSYSYAMTIAIFQCISHCQNKKKTIYEWMFRRKPLHKGLISMLLEMHFSLINKTLLAVCVITNSNSKTSYTGNIRMIYITSLFELPLKQKLSLRLKDYHFAIWMET